MVLTILEGLKYEKNLVTLHSMSRQDPSGVAQPARLMMVSSEDRFGYPAIQRFFTIFQNI